MGTMPDCQVCGLSGGRHSWDMPKGTLRRRLYGPIIPAWFEYEALENGKVKETGRMLVLRYIPQIPWIETIKGKVYSYSSLEFGTGGIVGTAPFTYVSDQVPE